MGKVGTQARWVTYLLLYLKGYQLLLIKYINIKVTKGLISQSSVVVYKYQKMEDIYMQEPQDMHQVVVRKPRPYDKISKGVQSEIYQFLDGKDLLRLESVNKKVSQAAKQDFLWRYLTKNALTITNQKYLGDSWKKHYWRNHGAQVFMTPQKFNYVMCPIRHFKEIVKIVECFDNLVFAADTKGMLTIFLINENDMENENDTLKLTTLNHESGIEYLKYQEKDEQLELVLVNGLGQVYTYEIEITAPGIFAVTKVSQNNLPFTNLPSNIYVCPLNETQIFVSNYPLDGNDFMKDTSVFIYDTIKRDIIYGEKLQIDLLSNNDALQEAVRGMSQNVAFQQRLPWQGFIQVVDQNVTLESVKADKIKQRLAVYDGQLLTVALFNKKLAIIDTKLNKYQQFIQKSNTVLYQDDSQIDVPLAMDLRLHKGLLLVNHLSCIKIIDFKQWKVTDNLDLKLGVSPMTQTQINKTTDEFCLIRKLVSKIEIVKMRLDIENKKFILPVSEVQEDDKNRINDMELQGKLLISATSEGGIKFRKIEGTQEEFKNAFFINAGSRTIKTYKEHPNKPGVSLVKAYQNKVIVVLGNLIRVYSFDFKTK